MWPVTPIPPKSIEGFILTFADKYSASIESLDYYRKMLSKIKTICMQKHYYGCFSLN